MKLLISALILTTFCVSGTFEWGSCPKVVLQSDFDLSKYLGNWFELIRNKDMKYEKGECSKANYSMNLDGTVRVFNSEVRDEQWSNIEGYAYCDSTNPAHCHVKFSKFAPAGDYQVVSTDYENYSLVFSCFSIGIAHWKWAWLLARDVNFDIAPYVSAIENFGIPASGLHYTQQTNCPASFY
ncbi:hypothetical protein SteCoe_37338 [Stentor coeruleus]|uniref:Apolipoprotein D n=1 Tax=Stentor coeruleus TaxID=5963 RepID=A0A1R2AN84_9CILI|nr:hypothetical protein SteCoe_37338 [Stentor coeruleus]